MRTAHFIDFEDSFSFNVIQKLQEVGLEVSHQYWTDFTQLPTADLLVLGPGPGHPDEYRALFPLIEEWRRLRKPLFGICLGHQIYWRVRGGQVQRSLFPKHGQKIKLTLTNSWKSFFSLPSQTWVQRYNSLAVPVSELSKGEGESLVMDGEIVITRGNKLLTYQFHPESEGTTYPHAFFKPLLGDLV